MKHVFYGLEFIRLFSIGNILIFQIDRLKLPLNVRISTTRTIPSAPGNTLLKWLGEQVQMAKLPVNS